MVLILPNETGQNALLSTAEKYLEPQMFSALVEQCRFKDINLHLPKFNMECTEDLKEPLTALGMGEAFSDAAEFPRISPASLKIDQVIHKTVLEVTDNGLTVAIEIAFSELDMPARFPLNPSLELVFDRPFIVTLVDRRNNLIFFEGLVTTLGSPPLKTSKGSSSEQQEDEQRDEKQDERAKMWAKKEVNGESAHRRGCPPVCQLSRPLPL
ncbi:putative Serpin (serine protease inhibitor) [Blattamonas nauphoetae]|uniref:Serpin (Serine protease inhibitor) n=1 Tax=Blattamonas nauphoetae TaxID=2049346 RepID=A0ABQ9YE91_9EUKA|nr:putative Serpin (serine protease inhibitor) [Blattamonas nauphoetae]